MTFIALAIGLKTIVHNLAEKYWYNKLYYGVPKIYTHFKNTRAIKQQVNTGNLTN